MVRRGMGIGPYIHLSKRSRSYEAMPTRNPVPRHGVYSSRAEDFISDRVTNAGYFSNYAMEEGYDTARKSRGRDAQLLREATDAIVLSESFATPQTSVAARRVARGRSMPPRAVSVPPRSLYPEAAIIASKIEAESYAAPRRPRSEYAARKYRALSRDSQESVYAKPARSVGLYASNPALPKLTERKAIRTDDGYSKPKNLLSWQYRLEAMMKPNDLVYQPASFSRIRSQVRQAQDGMDRHRQMLDRYLPEEGAESTDVAARILRKMEKERRDPTAGGGDTERQRATVKIPSFYACGVDPAHPPMSDLRRRIKRTLNKTRRSSVF